MYAMYLRKSRADKELEALGEGETLSRHKRILTELSQRGGYEIGGIYEEIVSGETIAARPQMQQLLADVEAGRWEGVLVMELERLARGDSIDQGVVARAFKLTGTLIITPAKVYDPLNEFDEEYFEFGLFMSRREYKTINRRLQAGRLASAKEGNFIGRFAPYGYDKVKIEGGRGYTLTPNDEADAVKLIYSLYVDEGVTPGLIAKRLTDMGYKPRNGGAQFPVASVRDILRNPVYCGKIRWKVREQRKKVVDGKVITQRLRTDGELYKGKHEAIISEEQWAAAQERTGKNPKKPIKFELANPFAHVLKCRECGRAMILRRNRRGEDYMICPNTLCEVSSAPYKVVEDYILEELRNSLNGLLLIKNSSCGSDNSIEISQLRKINAELEKVKAQQNKLYDLLEQEIYTQEIFIDRQIAIKAKREALEEQAAAITAKANKTINYDRTIKTLTELLENYNDLSPAERNKLLTESVLRIDYFRDKSNRYKQMPITVSVTLDL
ncbi:MAG: recombinase family protein [Ruminococcus sp.]|nr:recombinase family protein [Ruminococcus sp.]